jgi:hypothetical protein
MGEPIAKCVLTLFSMSAERSARANVAYPTTSLSDFSRSHRKRHLYACAGDDHIGIGKIEYLKQIPERLALWSGVVNWEKYGISKTLAHYCQDWLLIPEAGNERYNVRSKSEKPRYKIDMIHLRLFSDRRKVGPSSFEEPNPLPGKAKALSEELAWRDAGWIFNANCINLMRIGLGRWCGRDCIKDIMSYVPPQYGGLGLPPFPGIEKVLPPHIAYAIQNAEDPAIRKISGGITSKRVRGMILDAAEAERNLAKKYGLQVYTFAEAFRESEIRNTLPKHYAPSITSTRKSMVEDFVNIVDIARPEQKIAAMQQAFNGIPAKKKFLTYGQRQRRVVAGFRTYFTENACPFPDLDKVKENFFLHPGTFSLFVEKQSLEAKIPSPLLPSVTVGSLEMSGMIDFLRDFSVQSPDGSLPD